MRSLPFPPKSDRVRRRTLSAAAALGIVLAAVLAWWAAAAFADWSAAPAVPPRGDTDSGTAALVEAARDRRAAVAVPADDATRDAANASAAAAPSTGTGTLRLHVIWQTDGRPAVAVPIRIVPVGVADSRLAEREGLTDGDGVLIVDGLRAGRYAPQACFGGEVIADVPPAGETAATLAIPPGAAVRGDVVDATGRPVAGADVWLSYDSFRLIGAVVARTGADGSFALRSVACTPERHLGARGAGHGPSPSARLAAAPGSTVEVRLQLGAPAGVLQGRVVGPDGEIRANALVVVGRDDPRPSRLTDGTRALPPPPIRARTDARGEFRVAGVPAGRVPVLVRAPRCAPWQRDVELLPRGELALHVVLAPGVTLHGTAFTAGGSPADGVAIRVGDLDDPAGSLVHTGADGAYRLDTLPAGEFAAEATSSRDGRARARFVTLSGDVLRWDPQLACGATMTFRLVDERDAALAGWTVEVGATIDGSWDSRWGPTGADGRFTATNCAEADWVLRITEPGAAFATVQRAGIRPAADETVVRITAADRATAAVTGVVIDPGGTPLADAPVIVSRAGDPVARTATTAPGSGRFRLERMPAGEYTLRVAPPGFPAAAAGPRALGPSATWDAGELRLATPGWLALRLRRDDAAPLGRPGLHCRALEGAEADDLEVDAFGVARSAPLTAGRYRLYVHGDGLVSATHDLAITAGQVTELDLVLRAGVHVQIVFRDPPAGGPVPDAMRFRLFDAAGGVVGDVSLSRRRPAPFTWHVGVPPGSYRLDATTPDGAVHASAPLVLRDSPDQPRQLEIPLR